MRLMFLTLLCLLAAAGSAATQGTRSSHFYLAGSVERAIDHLGDWAANGFGGSIGFGLIPRTISTGDIEFVVRASVDAFPSDLPEGPDFTFLSAGLDLKLNLNHHCPNAIHLLLGGGWSRVKWSKLTTTGGITIDRVEKAPYASAGIGIEYRRSPLSPFAQVRLVYISGKMIGGYQFLKVALGVKL